MEPIYQTATSSGLLKQTVILNFAVFNGINDRISSVLIARPKDTSTVKHVGQ